tara:strand:- start:364 stop:564 length:201 start_codon:yes stop_codon:yes gene_type:complete
MVAVALFVERVELAKFKNNGEIVEKNEGNILRNKSRMGITVSSQYVEADYPYRNIHRHTKSTKHEA